MVGEHFPEEPQLGTVVQAVQLGQAAVQFRSQAQLAGVGIGGIFILPGAVPVEQGERPPQKPVPQPEDEVHHNTEEHQDEPQDGDELEHRQKGQEQAVDPEAGPVGRGHAPEQQQLPGVPFLQVTHFVGQDPGQFLYRKILEHGLVDNDVVIPQGTGVEGFFRVHIQVKGFPLEPAPLDHRFQGLFQHLLVRSPGGFPAAGKDHHPLEKGKLHQQPRYQDQHRHQPFLPPGIGIQGADGLGRQQERRQQQEERAPQGQEHIVDKKGYDHQKGAHSVDLLFTDRGGPPGVRPLQVPGSVGVPRRGTCPKLVPDG